MTTWFKRVFSSIGDTCRERIRQRAARRLNKKGTETEKYQFLRECMAGEEFANLEERYLRKIDICAKYKLDLEIQN